MKAKVWTNIKDCYEAGIVDDEGYTLTKEQTGFSYDVYHFPKTSSGLKLARIKAKEMLQACKNKSLTTKPN